ncbi:hypothetical protein [Flavobacterium psychrolimnae]|uniref:Uncharacterized protein n=1 Tax=Flavobacterium psychrolimnae TaxID=249351 RepID=A0A366AXJ3_9FLAO|nr:hypothetical protein [Flavobacterium psychrolimnae]RBN49371.1 hypothetical protein DR980_13060 [Flavobacterium psychrolimnae]
MTNISETLTETIKDDKFQDVIVDLSETTLDTLLKDGALKDIPIIGVVGIAKTTLTVQDKLFTKKLMVFLLQLKKTSNESRKKQIEKIEKDPEYKTKVGEKLLYIIDKCEDHEKAKYIGKLFQCFIEEKIEYENFLRASRSIELTYLGDLKRFINEKWKNMGMEEGGDLLGAGLMDAIYSSGEAMHGASNSSLKLEVSYIGKMIQELLAE